MHDIHGWLQSHCTYATVAPVSIHTTPSLHTFVFLSLSSSDDFDMALANVGAAGGAVGGAVGTEKSGAVGTDAESVLTLTTVSGAAGAGAAARGSCASTWT